MPTVSSVQAPAEQSLHPVKPVYPVTAVDTVAAGEAFNGGFAVALTEGQSFEEAVRWGMAAGAIAVTRPGAQAAMPNRDELRRLLEPEMTRALTA